MPVANGGRPSSDLPIFWEFVQYVIDTPHSSMDEHWKPTSNYCSMCVINYNFVIKFEDYIKEGQDFLKQSNLTKYVEVDELSKHINPNRPGEMSRYLYL